MAARGPGGSIGAAANGGFNGNGGQTKSNSSQGGGGAFTSKLTQGFQDTDDRDRLTSGGPDTTGSPNLTGRTTNPGGGVAQTRSADTPGQTSDRTGRPLTEGTTASISDPSLGQIVGALATPVPGLGTANTVLGAASKLLSSGSLIGGYDGGAIGESIDGPRGVKPGAVDGSVGQSVASNLNSRATVRPSDDTRLEDVASGAATSALLGDAPDDGATGAAFSDVMLADRRKPRSDMAGTNMLMGAMA